MTGSDTAHALDALAHEMRNGLNVVLAGIQLLEPGADGEILDETRIAAVGLMRDVERLIVSARLECGHRPNSGNIDVAGLVDAGLRRASREGCPISISQSGVHGEVDVPLLWAERLLADVLHRAHGAGCLAMTVTTQQLAASIVVRFQGQPDGDTGFDSQGMTGQSSESMASTLSMRLAQACGGSLQVETGNSFVAIIRFGATTGP